MFEVKGHKKHNFEAMKYLFHKASSITSLLYKDHGTSNWFDNSTSDAPQSTFQSSSQMEDLGHRAATFQLFISPLTYDNGMWSMRFTHEL